MPDPFDPRTAHAEAVDLLAGVRVADEAALVPVSRPAVVEGVVETSAVRVRRRRFSPLSFVAGAVVGAGAVLLLGLRQAADEEPSLG